MPFEIKSTVSLRDIHRRRLAGGIVHGLRRFLAIERIVEEEQPPSGLRRRDSACALLEQRNRRHHLNDDNPSSG